MCSFPDIRYCFRLAVTANFRVIDRNGPGTKVYVSNNFIYSTNRTVGITRYLRCVEKRDGCNGTATIVWRNSCTWATTFTFGRQSKVEKREVVSKLRRQAEASLYPFRVIYDNVASTHPAIKDVPYPEIEPVMAKRRRSNTEPVPTTKQEIVQKLTDKLRFFGCVSGGEGFALLFSDTKSVGLISGKKNMHVDATFKVEPRQFYQLLVIYGVKSETVLPSIYVLMTAKSRALYDAVFNFVKTLTSAEPPTIVIDFEVALRHSLQNIFKEARSQRCFFSTLHRLSGEKQLNWDWNR